MLQIVFAALLSFASAPPTAGAFVVVVHKDVPLADIQAERLSKIIQKKETRFSGALAIVPVDQLVSTSVRVAFSEAIHKKSARAIEAWWQQQVFSGRGVPPLAVIDDAAVIAFVKERAGAIGYVSAQAPVTASRLSPLSTRLSKKPSRNSALGLASKARPGRASAC